MIKMCAHIPRDTRRNVFKSPHAKVWAYVILKIKTEKALNEKNIQEVL